MNQTNFKKINNLRKKDSKALIFISKKSLFEWQVSK